MIDDEARGPTDDGVGSADATVVPRVLLVDDAADIRQMVRLYLERGDFEIVGEAADGREGVERAEELLPDVVILDMMMPRMSGPDAIPELLRVSPRSMIVMLSALSARMHEETTRTAGAFAYIEKSNISLDFGDQLHEMLCRFRAALDGHTAWAPEDDRPH